MSGFTRLRARARLKTVRGDRVAGNQVSSVIYLLPVLRGEAGPPRLPLVLAQCGLAYWKPAQPSFNAAAANNQPHVWGERGSSFSHVPH